MALRMQILPGLSPYGPLATAFPEAWGRRGAEGLIVEFTPTSSEVWVGNFAPGGGGRNSIRLHPNGRDVLVNARGATWKVNADTRHAETIADTVVEIWDVSDPTGVVLSLQGLALMRIGASGPMWRTRRLSWAGFKEVQVRGHDLCGFRWDPTMRSGAWIPFNVDLRTGTATGGGYRLGDA